MEDYRIVSVGRAKDIRGKKFGRLTVIDRVNNLKPKQTRWLCECDCGALTIVITSALNSGHTRSCGCLRGSKTISMPKEGYKYCSKCNKELPATTEYFYKNKNGKYGLKADCIACNNEQSRKYYNKNREQILAYQKEYRKANRELCIESTKRWRENNPEYIKKYTKKYQEENKDKIKKYMQAWRAENQEHLKTYRKIYYQNNKEQAKEYREVNKERYKKLISEWRKNNRTHCNLRTQKYRAKKAKLPATLTEKQWESIKEDFNYKCAYCGMTEEEHFEEFSENLHQEHFIPVSKGGEYTHNNIIPACRSCNSSKSDTDFFEWYPQFEHYDKERESFIIDYLGYYKDTNVQQIALFK